MICGLQIFQSFVQYWFEEAYPPPYHTTGIETAEEATSTFIICLLLVSIPSSLVAGKIADAKPSRNRMIMIVAMNFQGIAIAIFTFYHPGLWFVLLGAAAVGIGFWIIINGYFCGG